MIRTNLATRPFYNERAINFWIVVLATVVAGATVLNVSRAMTYSGSNTELATKAAQDEARATELRNTAARLRSSVDVRQIDAASVDARQANDLIDRRTFSWTELFNRFETTLPSDVRITSVRPMLDRDRRIVLTVTVLARTVDDVNQFMERLDSTGALQNVRSTQERTNENDQIESALEMVYIEHPADGATAPVAAPAVNTAPAQEERR